MSPLTSARFRLALFSTLAVAGLALAQDDHRLSKRMAARTGDVSARSSTAIRDGGNDLLSAPSNDECLGAVVVGALPWTSAPVDIADATPQDGDDGYHTCAGQGGSDRTIWYAFTPPATAAYTITTCPARGATGSTVYDTLVSIYDATSGCPLGGPTLACDDSTSCASALPGAPYVDQATILPVLTAGTPYYIVVGHYRDDVGGVTPGFENVVVHVEQSPAPTNDICTTPGTLELNQVVHGTTANAANDYRSSADPFCFSGIGQTLTSSSGIDVVYTFTAPAAGRYNFHYIQDDASAALRSQNPVLYLSHECPLPSPFGPAVPCIKGANRITENGAANGNRSEEIDCVPLNANEQVYLFFDDRITANLGGPFALEVTKCVRETEPNDTVATANAYPGCELSGAANTAADVDFFDLGAPPAGSKVFLGVDAVAANDGDFEMRLTNSTDTLGYDNDDGTSWVSANAPIIAGPFADGSELYARINRGPTSTPATASEPYRLYARIETGAAQNEVDTPSNASYFFANHVTGGGFVAGVMATQTDQDCFRFALNQGDNLAVFSDNNPARTGGTITNVWPILRNLTLGPPTASRFVGQVVRNNITPSPGTLTGSSPSVTSNFMNYRARYTGLYMACFAPTQDAASTENPAAGAYPLAYQGSISVNCGPVTSATSRITDVSITKTGPAGPVNTGDPIEYTITLTNDGTDIAEDVRLTDALPPQLVFLGLSVDDGFGGNDVGCIALPTPGANDEIIDCTNFTIAPGASTVYTIQVLVRSCIGAGLDIANTASITTLSTDPNPANDSASWTFTTIETGTCNDILCDPQIGCYPNACTINDHCEAGVCVSEAVNCDDNSVCTDDLCDPTNSTGAPCIHDSTEGDRCDDGIPCTLDYCDPLLFCVFPLAPAGYPCPGYIGFPGYPGYPSCPYAGVCNGFSIACIDPACEDGLPCTDDYSLPDSSDNCMCFHDTSYPGVSCEDGNPCTQSTTCDGSGDTIDHCGGGTPAGCDDGNPCTDDSCDPASGCVHTNNTAPCNDGNACTENDTCGGGVCHGSQITCDDGNPCTDDSCDPAHGCVHTNNTAPCNDNNLCTSGDVCGGGFCNPGGPLNCADSNLCTDDECSPVMGCFHHFNNAQCDDGNPCTFFDLCSNGSCHGGIATGCDDGNPCTDDGCSPATGCVHFNNTTPCSDGNGCTVGDACGGGSCHAGAPVVCTASDQCHVAGTCDPASGCSNPTVPDGTACNDGNPGTQDDACQAGVCSGGTVCNPTNDPKTWGWWYSQCTSGGHSGDSIENADAACVAANTPAFGGITTAAQVCEILSPSHGNNSAADKAEKQLMTLALNICSQRICPSQGLDATCSTVQSVGQALASGSSVLLNPGHTNQQLAVVECQATEINNGRALELDTVGVSREGNGVRITWAPPTLDDGTGTPSRYKVWRRPMGSMAPFTQIGITTGQSFLDANPGTTAWQYNVTSVF